MVKKVKQNEYNIYMCSKTLTFFTNPNFKENNVKILEIAKQIDQYLIGFFDITIITIICCNTLFLELSNYYKQKNSLLLILPKGSGKSCFLNDIIAKSNPKYFQILPKKIFESLLVKETEYFNNKILIHSDLITALFGLNIKQRQQLLSFFTEILSDGEYSREKMQLKTNCTAIFAIASENYALHKKELVDLTFLDRLMTVKIDISREQEQNILETISDKPIPNIKIPFPKSKQKITLVLSDGDKQLINKYSMQLKDFGIMSSIRAKKFIELFLMSNACFNGRKETNEYDLMLFTSLFSHFINSSDIPNKIKQLTYAIKNNPNANDSVLIEYLGWSKPTFYKHKKILDNMYGGLNDR